MTPAELKADAEAFAKVSGEVARRIKPLLDRAAEAEQTGDASQLDAALHALSAEHDAVMALVRENAAKVPAEGVALLMRNETELFDKATATRDGRRAAAVVHNKAIVDEVREEVGKAAAGKRTGDDLAIFFGAWQAMGWEISGSPSVTAYSAGTADFNGRRLSAAIVSLNVDLMNRAKGEHRTECLVQTLIDDPGFEMLRGAITKACKEKGVDEALKHWKDDHKFLEESTSGGVIPHP